MKITYIILLMVIGTTALLPQTLTLEQSVEIGLKNSKDLKISQSKVVSSQAKITESGSQMLPQLKFTAGYTRLSSVPDFEIYPYEGSIPVQIQETVLNTYSMKLSLQQPLFTGFRLSSLKSSADYNSASASLDYDKDINEYAYKIQTSFWNYYKAKEIKTLLEESLTQIGKHLEDTKSFLENGLATKNDVLKLEVQYSSTELQLIDAKNNVELARINFNKILSLDLKAATDVYSNLELKNQTQFNLDQILNESLNNRNELQSLKYKMMSSQEFVSAANSSWFPSVYLFANAYYARPNQRYLPIKDIDHGSWDVGVTLSWDVFNWGYTSSQVEMAEQNYIQIKTNLEQLKDMVQVEVYQAYLNYQKSFDKVQLSQTTVDQASENYRITEEKYNVQLATSTDLIDAEVSLLQSKTNLTNSLIDYTLAKVQLEKVIGRKIY